MIFIKAVISTCGLVLLAKIILFYFQQRTTAIGLLNKYFDRPSYSDYLGMQTEVENELECLIKAWVPKPDKSNKILLFVDDIDRCDIEKVVGIIDGLRVILDNPEIQKRLIIITAIDEYILEHSFNLKYKDYKEHIDVQEYLDKIFIIGLKLNDLESYEITEYIENLLPETSDQSTKATNTNTVKNLHVKKLFNSDTNNKSSNEEVSQIDSQFELTSREKKHLIQSIKKLKGATPRKIKIFYYKYLILKKLFISRLLEKELLEEWNKNHDEKIIFDTLLKVCNKEDPNELGKDKKQDIMDALKYTSKMVSVSLKSPEKTTE